jgi:hypothetical protein
MREPLQLREAATPTTLVMVRFGRTTLADDKLRQNCEVTFARWGLHGFSVFELPGGDYERLARLIPLLLDRQWLLEAPGAKLVADGFPLLPTREHPHWTVVLAEPTPTQFARVRRHFSEPKRNPVWAGPRWR